jgi:serine/threonine-protein kinase
MRIPADGGIPESIIKAKSGTLAFPQILPDGKSILYTAVAGTTQQSIMVQSLKSGEPKELFAGIGARYLPTGHIVYAVGNNLLAVPFDLDRLEVAGGSVPIVEGVFRTYTAQYAVSDSGTLVHIPRTTGAAALGRTLAWVDQMGKEEPLAASSNVYSFPKISPDWTRVALTAGIGANQDIWIWDLGRKTLTRLTFNKGIDRSPLWTLDGKRIAFVSSREGALDSFYWKAADGTGEDEKLGSVSGVRIIPSSWSADGKVLVFEGTVGTGTGFDIGVLSMEGDRKWRPLVQGEFTEANPQISPDGRWMAYLSNESGRTEIYVRPFPEVNSGKWQISTNGGQQPRWSPDNRELFYRNGDAMMGVAVETEPTFRAGLPKELFRSTYFSQYGHQWDISPDGKQFLMIKQPQSTGEVSAFGVPQRINIVLNWFEELK